MRVLLADDGSDGAEAAAGLAVAMRWPAGSTVRVVAAMEPSAALVPALPMSGRLVMSPDVEASIREYLEGEVAATVNRLAASGVEAAGEVLRGRPATVIADDAGRWQADLLVVGSRGHGPIASLVLGSVSAELVDRAPCPVLVARRPGADRVLFATDGSAVAGHAERIVAAWPVFAGAELRVVSVADVPRPWNTGIAPTMYRQAMDSYAKDVERAKTHHLAVARDAAARLAAAGRAVDPTMRSGDAAAEIIAEAASWRADLVVLGSRGLTGLSRLVLGSVARNVLQGSASSVLVVRETERPDGVG